MFQSNDLLLMMTGLRGVLFELNDLMHCVGSVIVQRQKKRIKREENLKRKKMNQTKTKRHSDMDL